MITEVVLEQSASVSQQHQALGVRDFLRRQLGAQHVHLRSWTRLPDLTVSLHDWSSPLANVLGFDRLFGKVSDDGPFRLFLRCRDWSKGRYAALQVLTRYQRLAPFPPRLQHDSMREAAMALQGLLGGLRGRSHLDRSLDRWRWVLRLNPLASCAVQLAALFWDAHESEPNEPMLAARALAHALKHAGIPRADLLRATELLELRGTGNLDPDSANLHDAEALCFFNVETWRHLHTFGARATVAEARRKLANVPPNVGVLIKTTRQPALIEELLRELDPAPAPAPPDPGRSSWVW